MKVLLAFTLLWATAIASPLRIRGRIFNGVDAYEREFPYTVFIETTIENAVKKCGGSLISSRWILTAAHCVDTSYDKSTITIYLGATDRDDAEIAYVISSPLPVRIHPLWNPITKENDIALVEIPDTPSCPGIKPVPLPPLPLTTPPTYIGESGIASGWGRTSDSSKLSLRLQCGRMRVAPNDLCKVLNPWINDSEMCIDTLTDLVSTCTGDSGGPFVLESTDELVGIISHSYTASCELGDPVVFTRITHYLIWIKELTGISY